LDLSQRRTRLDSVTKRLYYDDCYLTQFEATVVAADAERLYLDSTAFYPTAGGQPHDLGTIGGLAVVDVVDEGERIAHVMAGTPTSETVACEVDWKRRYDHMQQHTGQHLLSAVFAELFEYQTLSFHLGPDVSTIELGAKDLSEEQIDRAETRANAIVCEARPVSIGYDDASSAAGLRKPSARSGELRIVTIEGLDRSACGGTHVRSTAELGPLQVRRTEKIRGNVRLEFVCGARALRRAKQDYRVAAALTRLTAAAIDDLPEYVASLRARCGQAEKDRQRLAAELARFQGGALRDATEPGNDGVKRVLLRVPSIDEAVRTKLQAFAAQGKALAVAAGESPSGVLVVCSPHSGVNAGAVLKSILATAGASGGGSATLAQGSLPNAGVLTGLALALGFPDPSVTP
jgi:alanyl-tRNA synthetase